MSSNVITSIVRAFAVTTAALVLASCTHTPYPDQSSALPNPPHTESLPPSSGPSPTAADEGTTPEPTPSAQDPESQDRAGVQFTPSVEIYALDQLPMNQDGTAVSGCSPPSPDSLPDGIWYGQVSKWERSSVEFDLACIFHEDSPQRRNQLAEYDPETEPQPPYLVVNRNSAERSVPIGPGATIYPADYLFDDSNTYAFSEALSWLMPGDFWLYVNDGEITHAIVVYYP